MISPRAMGALWLAAINTPYEAIGVPAVVSPALVAWLIVGAAFPTFFVVTYVGFGMIDRHYLRRARR